VYAVVRTGGKEYKVSVGDVLEVEKLDAESGATVELGEILMASDGKEVHVGRPLVEGALVRAEVLEQTRAPKVVVFKMKRRKKYRRKRGHRQQLSVLKITGIELPKAEKPKKAEAKEEKPAEVKSEEAAEKKKPAAEKPAKAKAEKPKKKKAEKKKTEVKEKKAKTGPKKGKTKKAEAKEKGKAAEKKAAKGTKKKKESKTDK
jgi:large subunit ribosomal protein L21